VHYETLKDSFHDTEFNKYIGNFIPAYFLIAMAGWQLCNSSLELTFSHIFNCIVYFMNQIRLNQHQARHGMVDMSVYTHAKHQK